jgi:hypothetical protein
MVFDVFMLKWIFGELYHSQNDAPEGGLMLLLEIKL